MSIYEIYNWSLWKGFFGVLLCSRLNILYDPMHAHAFLRCHHLSIRMTVFPRAQFSSVENLLCYVKTGINQGRETFFIGIDSAWKIKKRKALLCISWRQEVLQNFIVPHLCGAPRIPCLLDLLHSFGIVRDRCAKLSGERREQTRRWAWYFVTGVRGKITNRIGWQAMQDIRNEGQGNIPLDFCPSAASIYAREQKTYSPRRLTFDVRLLFLFSPSLADLSEGKKDEKIR